MTLTIGSFKIQSYFHFFSCASASWRTGCYAPGGARRYSAHPRGPVVAAGSNPDDISRSPEPQWAPAAVDKFPSLYTDWSRGRSDLILIGRFFLFACHWTSRTNGTYDSISTIKSSWYNLKGLACHKDHILVLRLG